MKKITSILALFLMCFGISLQAAVTDLPEVSTKDAPKWYALKNTRSNKYATFVENGVKMSQNAELSYLSAFYFVGESAEAGAKVVNVFQQAMANFTSWNAEGINWKFTPVTGNGLNIVSTDPNQGGWNSWNDGGADVTYYLPADAGSYWTIEALTDAKVAELRTAQVTISKKATKDLLTSMASLKSLYGDLNAKISEIDKLNGDDFAALYNSLQQIKSDVYAKADGKSFRFVTYGRNTNGNDVVFEGNILRGAASGSINGIWTLKNLGNGSYKMLNFSTGKFISGNPVRSIPGDEKSELRFVMADNEQNAGSFYFVPKTNLKTENNANLRTGGNSLHESGGSNIVPWNHSDDQAASQYEIQPVDLAVTLDEYKKGQEAYAKFYDARFMMTELQSELGLVKDAAKYVCNNPETIENEPESKMENLLDGDIATYFHSSWKSTDKNGEVATPVHNLTAELSEAVQKLHFYIYERDTHLTRPVEIKVYGSADGTNFDAEPVKVINTTMSSTKGYISDEIDLGKVCKKVRFDITKTNNGQKYFAISEFYVLKADAKVKEVSDAVRAFENVNSVSNPGYVAAAQALNTFVEKRNVAQFKPAALEVINKAVEVAENAVPAYGQYPYGAKKLATDAVEAATSKAAIDSAIVAFRSSVNAPVYMLKSAALNQYSTGAAVYWTGSEWKWKAANNYDKSMWFKAVGYTKETMEAGKCSFINYVSGTPVYGKAEFEVVAIDKTQAFNLKYGNGSQDYLHCGKNNVITNYKASDADLTGGYSRSSAWNVVFVGSSYNLGKMGEDFFNAANAYKATLDTYKLDRKDIYGDGVNQTPKSAAMVKAVEDANALYNKLPFDATFVNQMAAMKKNLYDTYVAGFNMPTANTFYRVRCAGKGMKYVQSTLNETSDAVVMTGDRGAQAAFLYTDKGLVSYTAGQYLGTKGLSAVGTPVAVKFAHATNGRVGAYTVQVGEQFLNGEGATLVAKAANDNTDGCNWWLENVTELTVNVTEAGYASFHAPVAVTLPDTVKAYVGKVSADKKYLELTEVVGKVPANTAVILVAAAGNHNLAITSEEVAPVKDNALQGTVEAVKMENVYTLQNLNNVPAMYKFNGANLKGFKAYLPATVVTAQCLKFNFGEVTGIENVEGAQEAEVFYDLNGRRVLYPAHGVYVTASGKKVYFK